MKANYLSLIMIVTLAGVSLNGFGGQGGGFTMGGPVGRYYANTNLAGEVGFARRDVRLDFALNSLPPGGAGQHGDAAFRSVPSTNFSVQWTGQIISRFSETYTFSVLAKDGFRLRLRPTGASDWSTVIDPISTGTEVPKGFFAMTAGTKVDFEATLVHGQGPWAAQLRWSSASTPDEVVDVLVESGINNPDWSAGFTDIVKGARNSWEGTNNGTHPGMDTNGWPTGDCSYVFQESLNQGLDVDPLMCGLISFSFTGKADVSARGNLIEKSLTYRYDAALNKTSGSFIATNHGWNASYIFFKNSQRNEGGAGGFSDLRLMRPTAPDAMSSHDASNTLFTPQMLDALGHFSVIRHQYVANQQKEWAERTRPVYFNQSGGTISVPHYGIGGSSDNGPSWEIKVLLANESGRDLMISIPTVASGRNASEVESYLWKLANLLRYGSDGNEPYTSPVADPVYPPLNSNLRVYLELENELWNWGGIFWTDWANINALVAEDVKANNEDFKAINYDNLPLTQDSSGNYNSINTWRFRKILLRLYQISDIFRSVWSDDNMMTRIRPLYEWQYANVNETARLALVFGDRYFNNGDGQKHVATPHPVNHWLWGGGGATYYGAVNGNGLTDFIADPFFTVPALTQSGYKTNPPGSGWSFTGSAGLARDGGAGDDIPPAVKGSQMAFITDTGAVSIQVVFPTNMISKVHGVCFKAVNRVKTSASTADRENIRIYLDETNDITTRTFSQGDGYTPVAYTASSPWYANNVFWTQSEYYYSKSFIVEPGSTHTITFKGRGDISSITNGNQTVFLGEVRVTSVDRIFGDGMPGGGEAAGQPTGLNIQNTMNVEASWAKAFGLEQLSYEGGWSLGGDDGGSWVQLNAKYGDGRTLGVQGRFMDMFHKAGSAINVFGTYAQWPNWSDFYAVQGLLNVAQFPIIQGIDDRASQLKPEPENGVMAPCKLSVTKASLTDQADSVGRLTEPGSWINWNVIAPLSSKYLVQAVLANANTNGCILLVDDKAIAGPDQLSGSVFLTKGLHSIKVRRVGAAAVQVSSASVVFMEAPATPDSVSVSDGDGVAGLKWSPVSGATYYEIRYGTVSGVYTSILDVTNETSVLLTNLVNNQQYYFVVLSGSQNGLSAPSVEQGVIPLGESAPGTLAVWDFQGNAGNETNARPSSASSRIIVTPLIRGPGLAPNTADWAETMRANRFASEAVGNVYGANLAQSITKSQYYEFSVKPVSGQRVSFQKLEFLAFFQNAIGGAGISFSTDGTNFLRQLPATGLASNSQKPWSVDLSGESTLQNRTGITLFRIYLYGLGSYQASGLGDPTGNDITVTGLLAQSRVALSIAHELPSQIKLFWPTNEMIYSVASAFSTAPGAVWNVFSNVPTLENGFWVMRVPKTASHEFFQLVQ